MSIFAFSTKKDVVGLLGHFIQIELFNWSLLDFAAPRLNIPRKFPAKKSGQLREDVSGGHRGGFDDFLY